MQKIILLVIAMLITSGLVKLGFWQLERADEKRQILAKIQQAEQRPPLIYRQQDLSQKTHHSIIFSGSWDDKQQFIYDNQTRGGKAGYFVLTPFIITDTEMLLVNRGFVPWGRYRSVDANLDISAKKTTIKVKISAIPTRVRLKAEMIKPPFPIIIQHIDLAKMQQLVKRNFLPVLGLLDADDNNGFIRNWQPFYGSVAKHIGYALQWFSMAIVFVILAGYFYLKKIHKPKHKPH